MSKVRATSTTPPLSETPTTQRGRNRLTRQWYKEHENAPDVLCDTEEIMATFFIPLPEFIRLPDDRPFPRYQSMGPSTIKWLESFGEIPSRSLVEHQDPKFRNFADVRIIAASTVFRRYATSLRAEAELPLMEAMFHEFTPDAKEHEKPSFTDEEEQTFYRSVAEVAVSLDFVAFDMSTSSERVVAPFRDSGDISDEVMNRALDIALATIRSYQSAYYGAVRAPVTLIERELLPPVLLYALRSLQEIADRVPPVIQMLITGNLPKQVGLVQDLSGEDMEKFGKVLNSPSPLSRYLDLYRQGLVALSRGNTRECLVMIAVAAESLVNVVLAHLQWEECLTPETSAENWTPSLDTRIKRNFPDRLGGNWSDSTAGPVQNWSRDIADIRHRVVHAGYKPTIEEAKKSVQALDALVKFFGDRVAHSGNLRRYPRTALRLVGAEGLERRQRYTKAVKDLVRDPAQVNWDETFSRWYETQTLCIQDRKSPRQADLLRAEYYIVFTSPNKYYWVASDWATRKAVRVTVHLAVGAIDPVARLRTIRETQSEQTKYPISARVHGETVELANLVGDWVENYHLMPLMEVMCDGSDFSR